MPADLVDDAVEEVLEDDTIEELDEEITTTTTKRRRLNSENVYVFDSVDDATTARDSITYEDDSKVEGFRIFGFAPTPKDQPADKKFKLKRGDDRKLKNATTFVIARNSDLASAWLLESMGYVSSLYETKAKSGAGRSKSMILRGMLEYGKMLAMVAFGQKPPEGSDHNGILVTIEPAKNNDIKVVSADQAATFKKYYSSGGNYDHYREDDGTWKKFTKDE